MRVDVCLLSRKWKAREMRLIPTNLLKHSSFVFIGYAFDCSVAIAFVFPLAWTFELTKAQGRRMQGKGIYSKIGGLLVISFDSERVN
jgi:hypothetical protein